MLSKYRFGKLPKALQVVAMTANTFQVRAAEQLLNLTDPQSWTPHAYYELTKRFSINMSAEKFRVFLLQYLLPAVRRDVSQHKKLNYHLYSALRRGLFKPAAWFRGVLFPLCEDPTITVREAELVSSIVAKVAVAQQKSIPAIHSAISILRLTGMPYTGAVNVMLHALVRKQYALPRSVIGALYDWVVRFEAVDQKLPVLWFQTVLAVCQTYSSSLGSPEHFSPDQKAALKQLIKKTHKHALLSPEIVRCLSNRGDSLNVTMVEDSRMVY